MEQYFEKPNYQPNYCEENIWHLGKTYVDLGYSNGYVCFITNPAKTTPIWCQKKCRSFEEPVVWDYHVIFLCTLPDHQGLVICDFDSVLPLPSDWRHYLINAFKPSLKLLNQYQQYIRAVPVQKFLNIFSSDRSHMFDKETKRWFSEPPDWPLICGELASSSHTLFQFLMCESNQDLATESYGDVYTVEQFILWCENLEKSQQEGEEIKLKNNEDQKLELRELT